MRMRRSGSQTPGDVVLYNISVHMNWVFLAFQKIATNTDFKLAEDLGTLGLCTGAHWT